MSPADRMRPSEPLYDLLAAGYEDHFALAHRRLYDELAWERFVSRLPAGGSGLVVDAGCGVGRWARKLLALGYSVAGIEQSPGMLAELGRHRLGPGFSVAAKSMEDVGRDELMSPDCPGAEAVVAMGSVQYTRDPEAMIRKLGSWLRPGGTLAVLVDSLVALVLELVGSGRTDEALRRLSTRRGVWRVGECEADLHLFDRERLMSAFTIGGLVDVEAAGLLISASALGRDELIARAQTDYERMLSLERALATDPLLADAGKQLLVIGRRPAARSPVTGR
ncbi:MAG: class I SAM-dependent DNA methyltransferase [Nocardioides sp.]